MRLISHPEAHSGITVKWGAPYKAGAPQSFWQLPTPRRLQQVLRTEPPHSTLSLNGSPPPRATPGAKVLCRWRDSKALPVSKPETDRKRAVGVFPKNPSRGIIGRSDHRRATEILYFCPTRNNIRLSAQRGPFPEIGRFCSWCKRITNRSGQPVGVEYQRSSGFNALCVYSSAVVLLGAFLRDLVVQPLGFFVHRTDAEFGGFCLEC